MSTRGRIGIIREKIEGQPPLVESIYVHFDAYPEGVGKQLLDHWTTERKINRLIALGDLSSLGSVIGEMHDFDHHMARWSPGMSDEEYQKIHEESAAGKGWCLFYGRDRGELDCLSVTHPIDEFPDYGQEAEYVFDPETKSWAVRREAYNPVGWNTVTPWEGWVSIPEAIAIEQAARAEYEASKA